MRPLSRLGWQSIDFSEHDLDSTGYFHRQWKALLEVKENQTEMNLSKLTKHIKAMKWVTTMLEFWSTQVGSRNASLDYFVCDEAIPTPAAPTLLHNLPYSEMHGPVVYKLVA